MQFWKRALAAVLMSGCTLLPCVAGRQTAPGVVAIAFLRPKSSESEVVLIGGVRGGRFLSEQKASAYFKPGLRLNLYGPTGEGRGSVTLGKRHESLFGENATGIANGPGGEAEYLAATAPTKPHRRPVEEISSKSPYYETYATTVRNYLKANRVTVAQPKIERLLRTDLNGDGEPEVLILANSLPKETSGSMENFYSVALLRYVKKGGAVGVLPLITTVKPKIGDEEMYRIELSSLADLNGDGKTEIILSGHPYESIDYMAFTFDGRTTSKVFEFGWGP